MNAKRAVARGLADAFLAGAMGTEAMDVQAMQARAAHALGQDWPWLRGLAERVHRRFGAEESRMDRERLAEFIAADADFRAAWQPGDAHPRLRRFFLSAEQMGTPPAPMRSLRLPQLATPGELAAWLELSFNELEWLADCWGNERRGANEPLRHYVYRWIPKRHGERRLLEIPKSRLRAIQRRIHREILDDIPPHEAAHGFRKHRSCLSYVTPHLKQPVVIRMDLKEFFINVPARRIHALFTSLGFPRGVARYLTALCTNRTPDSIFSQTDPSAGARKIIWQQRKQYQAPHVPQGAPTSPALANLAAYRLDARLAALAQSMGIHYTRYADDLAFSGGTDLANNADRFHVLVCGIALEEGFTLNTRKTRVMRRGVRQQLTGIVLNEHPNVTRAEYDRLKAILYNCVRFGPASQNRAGHRDFRAYLAGKIAHIRSLNARRAARLSALFEQIVWESAA